MDHSHFFLNEHSLQKPTRQIFFNPEARDWQPFYSESKHQNLKDEVLNSRTGKVPLHTPEKNYSELEDFSDKRSGTNIRGLPSSINFRSGNSDFLSAIPYARSSYTVKRKLSYGGENSEFPTNVNFQKTKTYFPFEFIGHATRNSNVIIDSDTEEHPKKINPTMVTGGALGWHDGNGSAFETFTTQFETTKQLNKPRGKEKLKKRSNKQVALEKHIEQIRRKHAEFNWNINEPPKKLGKFQDSYPVHDLESQCVPTSPFSERYTSPSLYSVSEAPLISLPWKKGTDTTLTNRDEMYNHESRANYQRCHTKESTFKECWFDNAQGDFSENISNETKNIHLYPY